MNLQRQILCLVLGFAAKFVTGSLFVFSVYQDVVKDTFNYTQKEIEVMASLLNVGLGIGFVPGALFDRFGPQWTSAAGMVISVGAYMLLWSTTKSVSFYAKNSWLMAIYFFLCGFGSVFTYMVALNTNLINFHRRHAGKIVGFLNAFFAGSPSIFSVLYYHLFTHGDSTDPSNQDFAGFMLMFAVLFGLVDLLCAIFMRIDTDPATEMITPDIETKPVATVDTINTIISYSATDAHLDAPVDDTPEPDKAEKEDQATVLDPYRYIPLTLKQILTKLDYHLFLYLFALTSSIGLVYVTNVTAVSKAVGLNRFDDRLTIIIPTSNAILSALTGLFSDFFRHKVPKMWIVNFASVCYILSEVLTLLYADKIAFLALATAFAGIATGIVWSVFPTLAQEMFYIGNIGRNWGLAILVASALGFVNQAVFGAFYDNETPEGSTDCHGMKCIRGGAIVSLTFAIVALTLGIFTQLKRQVRLRKAHTRT